MRNTLFTFEGTFHWKEVTNIFIWANNLSLHNLFFCFKGASPYGASVTTRMNLSSNFGAMATIPSIQLLGLEMILHFLLGPEVLSFAKENKLVLSLGI